MTERLCRDCEGLVTEVPEPQDAWDLDLMCVICGAALSLGGLLLGEVDAREEQVA